MSTLNVLMELLVQLSAAIVTISGGALTSRLLQVDASTLAQLTRTWIRVEQDAADGRGLGYGGMRHDDH